MSAVAVIGRELRAESRRPGNYWLRVLAAGGLMMVFASLVITWQDDAAYLGRTLFRILYQTTLFACWILSPLMTADCISRERREGTLGLLFLTPLTPLDVILGKSGVHILRVLTLFVAALPILGMPFVLGGVAWQMAVPAVADLAGAVLMGIAAGLCASIKGGSTIQVMVRAEAYSLGLAPIAAMFHSMADAISVSLPFPSPFAFLELRGGFDIAVFGFILFWAARRLEKTWQDESVGTHQPGWVKVFSESKFWREFFHWNTSRTLDRNPMAWLQEYSWTARLTKWGWFLSFCFVGLVLLSSGDLLGGQPAAAALLTSGIAFSAAGSFRRERQDGLLELLLVTPLSTWRVLGGRVWGIFCHYFPAVIVLAVFWTGNHYLNPKLYKDLHDLPFANVLAFLSLLAVGLFLSLRRLNTLLAWVVTWLAAFLIPTFATVVLLSSGRLGPATAYLLQSAYHIALSATFLVLVHRNLSSRAFAGKTP
jgi:ABC-type transport system involved in multi-copper enzyme maturation permease subunit